MLFRSNAIFVHLTLVPYLAAAGELKTKPTQHSVRELMEIGIQPQVLICRAEQPLSKEIKRKIALFTNVETDAVLESPDLSTIYEVPLALKRQRADEVVMKRLGLTDLPDPDLIIRTSGEQRLSNFLLWQSAYSELMFIDKLWPDFDKEDLADAVREFQQRDRRYGATAESR